MAPNNIEESIASLVPNYKIINRDISLRLGFTAQTLQLPVNTDPNGRTAWILKDVDDYVWYLGERVTTAEGQLVEIDPANSEQELWDRDSPDYYHDLSMAFSLLIKIPYHSIRIVNSKYEGADIALFEVSYRHTPDGITYTEIGRFLSVAIINAFLECNPDNRDLKLEEITEDIVNDSGITLEEAMESI